MGLLLKNGADVNSRTASNSTALHVAAGEGHAEVVGLLLDGGADMNAGRATPPLCRNDWEIACLRSSGKRRLDGGGMFPKAPPRRDPRGREFGQEE